MLLKIYYDGSWDKDSLTLCGVAATESVWQGFAPKWEGVLRKHLVRDDIFHMRDAMGFYGNFSRGHGWNETRRSLLLTDLINVIGSFRGPSHHLVAYSCTVLLDDWRLAKERIPKLPEPHAMCVNFCVGAFHLPMECADEKKPVLLYFDRKERFMHTIRRVWERRRKQPGKFRQIAAIENVDSRCYPLQVADLLAWIKNRQRPHAQESFVDSLRVAALLMVKHSSLYYDLDKIVEHYPRGILRPGVTN
jgi:hypothetical protein